MKSFSMNKFILSSNCKIVKGVKNSILIDLQNEKIYFLTANLFAYLVLNNVKKSKLTKEERLKLEILKKLGIIIFSDFIKKDDIEYNYDFKQPYFISNAIIIISKFTLKYLKKIVNDLNKLLCKYIEIRVETINSINSILLLEEILSNFNYSYIETIDLIISLNEDIDLKGFFENYPRLNKVVNYNTQQVHDKNQLSFITKQKGFSKKNCGNISPYFFSFNYTSFYSCLNHNSCLIKKISIDSEGNIRNCPSMPQSFGNIKDTTLQQALDHPDFKKYWNHKKDDIEVCKDCEFRYICTDCRAYLEDPHNEYSKPLKCGYDPYTGEWSEWSTNPLKQVAIKYYGMEEIINY